MRNLRLGAGSIAAIFGILGCGQAGTPGTLEQPLEQAEFDFANQTDRAQFTAQDLQLIGDGAIGPYALYRVTGPSPKLIGPVVHVDGGVYAMLCGAKGYFPPSGATFAPFNRVTLSGGIDGETPYVSIQQNASTTCVSADDHFGAKNITGNQPSGNTGGNLGVPAPSSTGNIDTPSTGGATVERPIVAFTAEVGSTVLIRRVSLNRQVIDNHAQTHATPIVCCQGDGCNLQSPPNSTTTTVTPPQNPITPPNPG